MLRCLATGRRRGRRPAKPARRQRKDLAITARSSTNYGARSRHFAARVMNNAARAATALPGDKQNLALREIADLREYGCEFLSNPALWDNASSLEVFLRDAQNESLARSPYFLGRSPCVRFAGSRAKPLSLFCPRACGCHRGDQDCPTTCPERTASDPLCPAWQQQILVGPLYKGVCPRLPAAQLFDAGDGEDAGTAVG